MDENPKRQLLVQGLPRYPAEIARSLWAMEETRQRTKQTLDGIDPKIIDWRPPRGGNTIGTLLYHIADIEMDWLFVEILQQEDRPPAVRELLPAATRDEAGHLTQITGESIERHLRRLDVSRAIFLSSLLEMTVEDFQRPRELDDYFVTPEWILHHLMQHEAEHRGQIGEIRMLAGDP